MYIFSTCILTGDNAFAKQTTFSCGVIKDVYLLYFQIAVVKNIFLENNNIGINYCHWTPSILFTLLQYILTQ